MSTSVLAEKIRTFRQILEVKAKASGLPPARLLLISKTVPWPRILEAYQAGIRDFGENKVQELEEKFRHLPADIRWHFVGRLQTNKVKFLLGDVAARNGVPLIHSLDRLELAEVLNGTAEKKKITKVPCLIQVNSSGEASKAGISAEEVPAFVRKIQKMPRLELQGLMTIGPLSEDLNKIRSSFRIVRHLQAESEKQFPEYSWKVLSMGMSGDYEIAIEEGANLLRIGTAIFGERAKP